MTWNSVALEPKYVSSIIATTHTLSDHESGNTDVGGLNL